jgi:glycosyltransferase involved in cell wall biosynthesis
MGSNPFISVVLPCYNTEKWILNSINSILSQTYANFELIVIDDCSTDLTVQLIKEINDERIHLYVKEENSGLVNSLNFGMQKSNGSYIAIMHADDYSMPNRLELQVSYMESNKDVVCCGGWIELMNNGQVVQQPCDSDIIRLTMLDYNPVAHPSVMLRSSVIKEYGLKYNNYFAEGAEDYEFWHQLFQIGQITNIPHVLIKYRIHENQKSELYRKKIIYLTDQVRKMFYADLLPSIDYNPIIHNFPESSQNGFSSMDFHTMLNQLRHLKVLNETKMLFKKEIFNKHIDKKIFYLIRSYYYNHFNLWEIFISLLKFPQDNYKAMKSYFKIGRL